VDSEGFEAARLWTEKAKGEEKMINEGFPRKKLSWLLFVLYFVAFQIIVLLTNVINHLTILGLAALMVLFMGFYFFIQDSFLSFEYKWIDGELHLERILGRGNHVYLVIPRLQIKTLEAYDRKKRISHTHWFCHRHEKEGLYLLTTTEGKQYVIKPSDALLEAIDAKSLI